MRLTFLSWFILCLGIAAGAFFAFAAGVPQAVYADDLSHMTSAIGLVFVGTAGWLGRQAWLGDNPSRSCAFPDLTWGNKAPEICAMLGLVGTVIGLSMQAKALMSGPASFGALATSLFTTACGATAAILLIVMTHVVEAGIRRARQ